MAIAWPLYAVGRGPEVQPVEALQVHELGGVGGGVEVAPPCGLAPSRRVAVAWVSAACGAFAFEDEVGCEASGLGLPDDGWRWAQS